MHTPPTLQLLSAEFALRVARVPWFLHARFRHQRQLLASTSHTTHMFRQNRQRSLSDASRLNLGFRQQRQLPLPLRLIRWPRVPPSPHGSRRRRSERAEASGGAGKRAEGQRVRSDSDRNHAGSRHFPSLLNRANSNNWLQWPPPLRYIVLARTRTCTAIFDANAAKTATLATHQLARISATRSPTSGATLPALRLPD
jgi:hypothetical protein